MDESPHRLPSSNISSQGETTHHNESDPQKRGPLSLHTYQRTKDPQSRPADKQRPKDENRREQTKTGKNSPFAPYKWTRYGRKVYNKIERPQTPATAAAAIPPHLQPLKNPALKNSRWVDESPAEGKRAAILGHLRPVLKIAPAKEGQKGTKKEHPQQEKGHFGNIPTPLPHLNMDTLDPSLNSRHNFRHTFSGRISKKTLDIWANGLENLGG